MFSDYGLTRLQIYVRSIMFSPYIEPLIRLRDWAIRWWLILMVGTVVAAGVLGSVELGIRAIVRALTGHAV